MRSERGSARVLGLAGLGIVAAAVAAVFVLGGDSGVDSGVDSPRDPPTDDPPDTLRTGTSSGRVGGRATDFVGPVDRAIADAAAMAMATEPVKLVAAPDPAAIVGSWRASAGTIAAGVGGAAQVAPTNAADDRRFDIQSESAGLVARFEPDPDPIPLRADGDRFKGSRTDPDGTTVALDIGIAGKELSIEVRVSGDPELRWGFRASRVR